MNKRIIFFLFILVIGAVAGVFGYLSSKITTFDECYKAGRLVYRISFYDSFDLGPNKTECVLWSGKTFYRFETPESNNIESAVLESASLPPASDGAD